MPKIFLAATSRIRSAVDKSIPPVFLLESFMFLRPQTKKQDEYIRWCLSGEEFLLDSGAFSFMNKSKFTENFDYSLLDKYVDDYIDFINRYDIKNFFEMDLDVVIGYDKVLKYRKRIETLTHKKVIPVWHINRGIDEFHNMCKEYDYVAIGGIASKELTDKILIRELCKIAHDYGCKIHGLGYLSLKELNSNLCPFDTVDGTSWQSHIRGKEFKLENGIMFAEKTDKYWKDIEYSNFELWKRFCKEKEFL